MSDKPEDPKPPEVPKAWQQPPDPNWRPTQRYDKEEGMSPKRAIWTVLGMLALVIVGIPVLGILLLLGRCFLG